MVTKHSEFIQITGRAGKSFHAKNGLALTIEVSREGSQYPTRYTAWEFPAPVPNQGDIVTVKGWFSDKVTKKEDKTYVDRNLNKPILVSVERPEPAASSPEWDAVTPPDYGESSDPGESTVWHEPGQAAL